MAKGCDSSWDFDYKSRVDALVDEGIHLSVAT